MLEVELLLLMEVKHVLAVVVVKLLLLLEEEGYVLKVGV